MNIQINYGNNEVTIMKERMDEESKTALISYRIQRAFETLKEAEVMRREGFYNAAVNRLYYACYYVTIALLLKCDIQLRPIMV